MPTCHIITLCGRKCLLKANLIWLRYVQTLQRKEKKKNKTFNGVDFFFSPCVPMPNSFNIYNLKESSGMHFLTRICSVWMNLCQTHFRGGILRFDLGRSCSDCGTVSLIQLRAILSHLAHTKPTWMLPVMRVIFFFFPQVDFWWYNVCALHIDPIWKWAQSKWSSGSHLFEIQGFNGFKGLCVKTELIYLLAYMASSRMQD